ncbi:MAG: peptide chain release factor N(5)-glutamine methyltransferase [Clostridium sp.]
MKKCDVGGQALIEGVMMRGRKGLATAIRTPNKDIEVKVERTVPVTIRNKKVNIPFIRGAFILLDSMITGVKTLNYSASFIEDEEDDEEPSRFEKWISNKFGDKADDIIITVTTIISMLMAVLLFFGVPTIIASIFKYIGISIIGLNFIEAIIRISILVLYCYLISKIEDIHRTFQYHGAEHKTIFCYENDEELTVENVKKYSRFHPRCGTNFLFLIMFVSILVFSFTGWGSVWQRLALRIILIPLISGITYEIIKWLGSSNNKLSKIVAKPGLMLQKLTTREPDDDQIEVAIAALKAAEGIKDKMPTIGELLDLGVNELRDSGIDTYLLDSKLLLQKSIDRDKLYLMVNREEEVNEDKVILYKCLLEKRKNKMPIKYILGEAEFMGLDFYVESGVLIPRGDTENLVEEVLKYIKDDDNKKVLDLCCGSGAIGISLAQFRKNINVDLVDLYDVPEKVTNININKHEVSDRAKFIKSNLIENILDNKYDIIVSNPPYIKEEVIPTLMEDVKDYEPITALVGGQDGLVFYKEIISNSYKILNENGILAFEIGHDQGKEVKELMEQAGYSEIYVVKDLASLDRVVIGHL